MFRMSFDRSMLENVEDPPLSVFMRMRTRPYVCSLHSCVHNQALCVRRPIHAYTYLFLSHANAVSNLCTCATS